MNRKCVFSAIISAMIMCTIQAALAYKSKKEMQISGHLFDMAELYNNGTEGRYQNPENAAIYYASSANAGNPKAMNRLGKMYESGFGVKLDKSQALNWYLRAESKGDTDAMVNIGLYYQNLSSEFKKEEEAVKWFNKAADCGSPVAMKHLGHCYLLGIGVAKDGFRALEWYTKSAEAGDPESMYELGECYTQAKCGPTKTEEGVKWIIKAAESGHRNAIGSVSWFYENGVGVKKDKIEAEKWRKRIEHEINREKEAAKRILYPQPID